MVDALILLLNRKKITDGQNGDAYPGTSQTSRVAKH